MENYKTFCCEKETKEIIGFTANEYLPAEEILINYCTKCGKMFRNGYLLYGLSEYLQKN